MTTDGLAAVRLPLPPGAPIDPWALTGEDGLLVAAPDRTLVGVGRMAVLALPGGLADPSGAVRAVDALAAVPCTDHLTGADGAAGHDGPTPFGHPMVAFGALPFDRSAPTELVVCALTYGREADGTEWATVVGAPDELAALLGAATGPGGAEHARAAAAVRDRLVALADRPAAPAPEAPAAPVPGLTDEGFCRAVEAGLEEIAAGRLAKVVLARHIDVPLEHPIDQPDLLARWRNLEPSCTLLAMATPEGRFLAASPELLVARSGDRVESTPLAGTTGRGDGAGGVLPSALLESAKDADEHRLVVEAIAEALGRCTEALDVPSGPQLVDLRTVTHLATPLRGRLAADGDGRRPSALDLVAALHPTPAVGGVPREAAVTRLAALEAVPRGPYAGPVGYVDGAGDGRWMVGIRAVVLDGRRARVTAGVGVVAGSVPSTELAEVDLKLRSVLDVVVPGSAATVLHRDAALT